MFSERDLAIDVYTDLPPCLEHLESWYSILRCTGIRAASKLSPGHPHNVDRNCIYYIISKATGITLVLFLTVSNYRVGFIPVFNGS